MRAYATERLPGHAVVFLLVGLALCFRATVGQAQSVTLVDLAVEGATTTDPQLIKNVSGLVVGRTITREDIQQAAHQVFGLNLFEDVRLEGEDVSGNLRLIIHVKELRRLDKIVFKGNKQLKEKDFTPAIKPGQTVGPSALKDAERTIRSAYQKKGYFLADIHAELKPSATAGQVDAVFEIKENNPVRVDKVDFEGNAQLSVGELTKKMQNKPHGFLRSLFGSTHFNREKYADDKKAVTDVYRRNGFLDAVILSDTIMLNSDKTGVTIRMTVNEGPRYYFGTTSFTGMSVLKEDQLRRALRYRKGAIFDQEKFDKSQEEIYNAYMEEGYLYARVVDETKTQDSTVNISFDISEGVPAHVRRIDINGNTKTKDKVIRRELTLFPGQVFRRSALQRSLRNVMLLNYFGNVNPEFHELPDGRVDLSLKVQEKPTGQIQVGGAYSEQDHLVGTLDLGIPNLFGGGQSANFLLEFGARRQSYQIGYTEPWFMDTPTSVGFDAQKLQRTWDDPRFAGTDDFTERTTGLSTRLGRRLRWPDDYFSVLWNYRLEKQQYTDFSASVPAADQASITSQGNGVISSTGFTIQRDSRDLPEFATRGSRATYGVEFGGGILHGDWTYTKHSFSYAKFWRLWKGFVLAPVWNLGLIEGNADRTSLPYSELYYAGGIRSDGMIRGYDDRSIFAFADTASHPVAIQAITGSLIGDLVTGRKPVYSPGGYLRGQAIGVMNAQITFPIVPQQIQGLVFFDAGNVWLNAGRMNLSNLYTSYGLGFRLSVPGMGMLGFDFGIPLRDAPLGGGQKGKVKPHFQFGGSF